MQLVGRLTLNRNTDNSFAETEQAAFHLGNLVPGIEPTNDPLLQGRLFSYLDTRVNRFNRANFTQLPINRAHAPVNDMLRDGSVGPAVVRRAPVSFADHYTQAALFYRSLSPIEQEHVVDAFTFELGKCFEKSVKKRLLAVLADVDPGLCEQVAAGLGLGAPQGTPVGEVAVSPALAQVTEDTWPVAGRRVGVIAGPGADLAGIASGSATV